LFGGIYHSVPTAVPGRPSELLRDESYEAFATEMADIARPSVLYTSTVDGFVHAFDLAPFPGSDDAAARAVDSEENNELWAFIPPAVLPKLKLQYPNTHKVLLDGVPIIKDVVATKVGEGDAAVLTGYERIEADAQAGIGFWRTLMVQSFGEGVIDGGYFALDITEPDRVTDQQPTFRWQLTHDKSDQPLFGLGGTPLITTVFINDGEGVPHEIAVAVLPGGNGAPGSGSSSTPATIVMDTKPEDFKTTRDVRAYPGALPARSLTIVRLDNGEILRTFRPNTTGTTIKSDVLTATDIPSPITGQPKAYPDLTGAVADRIFVGDRDGRLWRVDVSSQDPEDWEMKIFYDAFEDETDVEKGQPVFLPPVISVDDVGDVTVAFATGNQELDNTNNRVISLTERLNDENEFYAHVNWIQKLDSSDRVTGPMVLFNRALYFAVSHPPATTGVTCDVGNSKVYGVHYIESSDFEEATEKEEDPDPTTGPAPAPDATSLVIASQPGLVFGVSLEQEPTCASAAEVIEGNDSFGYGEVKMSTEIHPGKYYLTFEASGNDTGGSDSRGVLEVRKELDSPKLAVTFQSWAVVYE
jgi:type IV pilus assembly protein PilY1